MKKAERYLESLRRKVEKCPKGYSLVYDNDKCHIYMVKDGCDFKDGTQRGSGAMHSNIPVAYGKSSDAGHTIIVGDGIEVSLEAVSDDALQEWQLED